MKLFTKTSKLIFFLCFGLSVFNSIEGLSQTKADSMFQHLNEISLEELMNMAVITASKLEEGAASAPATIHVINQDQIKARGYRSLLDVLQDLPDFSVFDLNASETRNSLILRGIEGKPNLVILLDGVKITSPTNEDYELAENYPVNLAKQIEIVYGPASALYGADAVSGIINIITKSAQGKKLEVNAETGAGTNGYWNGSLWMSKNLSNDVSLTVSGQYSIDKFTNFEDLHKDDPTFDLSGMKTGTFNTDLGKITPKLKFDPEITVAPYKYYNVFAKFQVKDFAFSIFHNMAQCPSSMGYTPQNAIYNEDIFFKKYITSISSSYTKKFDKLTSSTQIIGSRFDLDPESSYRNQYVGLERGYKFSFSNMMKAEEQLTWNISNKMNLIGGATYEYFTSIPKTADLDAAVDTKKQIAGVLMGTKTKYNPDGIPEDFFMFKYSNFGSYLQTQYAPNEKFILTLGARYDNNSLYGNSFNPRFGIVVKPTTKTTIKLLYGSAFLGATPYNMGQHFGSFYTEDEGKTYKSSYWWLPNPELEPLKEKTGEISINQFIGDDFSITLTGYYIALTNLYSVTGDADYKNFYNGKFKGWPVSFIQIPINEGEQTNYGGNLQLNHSYRWSSNRVNSYLSVSYVDGKIQQKAGTLDKKAEIANIVPVTVRLGTDVFIGKLSFSPRLTYFTDQSSTIFEDPKNPDKRKTIKGYTMLNIAAQYTPVKMLSLFLDVRNALNQEYRVGYGEGQLQQKIRVFGGIRINLK